MKEIPRKISRRLSFLLERFIKRCLKEVNQRQIHANLVLELAENYFVILSQYVVLVFMPLKQII